MRVFVMGFSSHAKLCHQNIYFTILENRIQVQNGQFQVYWHLIHSKKKFENIFKFFLFVRKIIRINTLIVPIFFKNFSCFMKTEEGVWKSFIFTKRIKNESQLVDLHVKQWYRPTHKNCKFFWNWNYLWNEFNFISLLFLRSTWRLKRKDHQHRNYVSQ